MEELDSGGTSTWTPRASRWEWSPHCFFLYKATDHVKPNLIIQTLAAEAPHQMDLDSKPSSESSQLPVIHETKPCVELPHENVKESEECRKKCVKDRLKGLADKYVACLHAVDLGSRDMRGYAGGPAVIPGPQPFESISAN